MNAIVQAKATITSRSLDQLEADIVGLSQHINASEYEFLVLLREFDLRQGWKAYHFNNCAEWLNMKCGVSPRTAREKLRVARALFDLPCVSRAFQTGALSYSKARALSRVATPRNARELLEFALKANAASVDRHCFELRYVQRSASTADANRAYLSRYLSYTPNADGTVSISAELPKEQADLVIKALERSLAQLENADDAFFLPMAAVPRNGANMKRTVHVNRLPISRSRLMHWLRSAGLTWPVARTSAAARQTTTRSRCTSMRNPCASRRMSTARATCPSNPCDGCAVTALSYRWCMKRVGPRLLAESTGWLIRS